MDGDLPAALRGQLVEVLMDHPGKFFGFDDADWCLHPMDPVRTRDPAVSDGFGGEALEAGYASGEDKESVKSGIALRGEQSAAGENDLRMGSRV